MTKQEKLELLDKTSKIFNKKNIDERFAIRIHTNAQVIRTIESNKETMKRSYERQIKELNDWQNNLYEALERDLRSSL